MYCQEPLGSWDDDEISMIWDNELKYMNNITIFKSNYCRTQAKQLDEKKNYHSHQRVSYPIMLIKYASYKS